jgi:hypothetical protein
MPMNASKRSLASAEILKRLMDPSRADPVTWSSSELAQMLEHQLNAPLADEIARAAASTNRGSGSAAKILKETGCKTAAELLRHDAPSVPALKLLKDFAKSLMTDQADSLPRDVGRVLYVLTILRGRAVHLHEVTTLSDESITREARRCLSFIWLPESVRLMIREGLANRMAR